MKNGNTELAAYIYLLSAVFLWGGNWVAVRYAVQVMPHLVVVTVRSMLAALVLLAVLRLTTRKRLTLDNWKVLAFLGLVGIFGFNILQYTGLKYTTAVNGSLINATTPIITILLARIIIKERLSYIQLLGALVSFSGVGWVITDGCWEVISILNFRSGDLIMILAALCWAIYTIYGRKPTLENSALQVTAYATLFAALYFMPLGIIQYQSSPFYKVSWEMMILIAYLVLVAAVALAAWLKGVSIIGPSRASVFMSLVPIFTALFACLFLGEMLKLPQIIGAAFVIGGVYFTTNPLFAAKTRIEVENE